MLFKRTWSLPQTQSPLTRTRSLPQTQSPLTRTQLGVFTRRTFLDPDDPGGTGSDDDSEDDDDEDSDDPPSGEKKFSQQDLDDVVKKRVRKLKAENAALNKKLSDQDTKVDALQDQLDEIVAKQGSGDKTSGELELQIKRLTRENEQLKSELADAQKGRASAEQQLSLTSRDSRVKEVLIEAGAVDLKSAQRYIAPDLEYDEDEQDWFIKDEKGRHVPITRDAVFEILPDHMKKPKMQGGSGANGGSTRRKAQQKTLEAAEARLAELQRKAQSSNDDHDLVAWQTAKREVQKLRAELND